MIWNFGNPLKVLENIAAGYSPIGALYEIIKNLDDEKATEIYIEFDSEKNKIYVYGNSTGMTVEGFERMIQSIGHSIKGLRNQGIGMMSFLRIGKSLHMVSKAKNEYLVGSCIRKDPVLESKPDPHMLSGSEISNYQEEIRRLKIWEQGTVTIIDGIGKANSPYMPGMNFDFEKEFSKIKIDNSLIKKLRQKIAKIKYVVIHNGQKYTLNKLAYTKASKDSVGMKIPSMDYPFITTQGKKRYSFRFNGFTYEIETQIIASVKSDISNELTLSFHGQDAMKTSEACKNIHSLSKNSIFKGNEYTKYIDGWVDMTVTSTDGGPIIQVYDINRKSMLFPDAMNETIGNILGFIETEALSKMVEDYVGKIKKGRNQASSLRINSVMHAIFRRFPDLFSHTVNVKNENEVFQGKTKCPACGLTMAATRGKILQKPPKKDEIIHDTVASKYQCLHCGHIWGHRNYTAPIRTKPSITKPFYSGVSVEKERERRRGFGYLFEVSPIGDDTEHRYFIVGTKITINNEHPDYKYLASKSKTDKRSLYRYEYMVAIMAVFSDSRYVKNEYEYYKNSLEDAMVCLDIAEAEGLFDSAGPVNPENDEREVANIAHAEKLAGGWGAKINVS